VSSGAPHKEHSAVGHPTYRFSPGRHPFGTDFNRVACHVSHPPRLDTMPEEGNRRRWRCRAMPLH
jgi:hypothetical protein